ncbi:MAG: hypothetical protein IPG33_02655 [Betaproteobacteria bacterium]|nr:hypothetical protein [Betaproteobacteria bacterium]
MEHGYVVKFWLQITQDEQLRRFREREKPSPDSGFKITQEDWRNREKFRAPTTPRCAT